MTVETNKGKKIKLSEAQRRVLEVLTQENGKLWVSRIWGSVCDGTRYYVKSDVTDMTNFKESTFDKLHYADLVKEDYDRQRLTKNTSTRHYYLTEKGKQALADGFWRE